MYDYAMLATVTYLHYIDACPSLGFHLNIDRGIGREDIDEIKAYALQTINQPIRFSLVCIPRHQHTYTTALTSQRHMLAQEECRRRSQPVVGEPR